jgi:hypothetical protein
MSFKLPRVSALLASFAFASLATNVLAQSAPQTPALGLVAQASQAKIGNAAAAEGASIYSGDFLSTSNSGSLLVRIGQLSLQLQPNSSLHIYSAPYGAVAELNSGTVIYTTSAGPKNLVIVASDVRVTPDIAYSDFGRVSMDDPCDITVYSQRGDVNVKVGSESRTVEEAKAYRVRAENALEYRKYVSPDADNYHDYHVHRPCAPLDLVHGHPPIAPAQSHFLLATAVLLGAGTGIGIWKATESPSAP